MEAEKNAWIIVDGFLIKWLTLLVKKFHRATADNFSDPGDDYRVLGLLGLAHSNNMSNNSINLYSDSNLHRDGNLHSDSNLHRNKNDGLRHH